MARVAKLAGETLSVLTVTEGVEYHLTTGTNEGDIRVTPKVFGKFVNTSAFEVPQIVVNGIRGITDAPAETPKGK